MASIDTGTDDLLASLDEGVAVLTLNRLEALNAISKEMNAALQKCLSDFELDPAVRCIVLTGAGKGFCAGGDVKGMAIAGDGAVGNNTIDGAIHLQRVHQRATSGNFSKCPSPPSQRCPVPRQGEGYPMHLPVTSA